MVLLRILSPRARPFKVETRWGPARCADVFGTWAKLSSFSSERENSIKYLGCLSGGCPVYIIIVVWGSFPAGSTGGLTTSHTTSVFLGGALQKTVP